MLPTLLHLGHLTLPTFGVLAALGLIAALQLSQMTARRLGVDPEEAWDAGLVAGAGAFVLSRLFLVATYFRSFRTFPILLLMVPSLTATGMLLTGVVLIVWLRWRGVPLLALLDVWAPCATLVWGFLALGHFAEGSDPGMPAARLGLPSHHGAARTYPVALLAAVCAGTITLGLLLWRPRARQTGRMTAMALVLTGVAQFLLTFLREPYTYEPPFPSLLDPIQWIALGMIVAGAAVLGTGALVPSHSRKDVSHAV